MSWPPGTSHMYAGASRPAPSIVVTSNLTTLFTCIIWISGQPIGIISGAGCATVQPLSHQCHSGLPGVLLNSTVIISDVSRRDAALIAKVLQIPVRGPQFAAARGTGHRGRGRGRISPLNRYTPSLDYPPMPSNYNTFPAAQNAPFDLPLPPPSQSLQQQAQVHCLYDVGQALPWHARRYQPNRDINTLLQGSDTWGQ